MRQLMPQQVRLDRVYGREDCGWEVTAITKDQSGASRRKQRPESRVKSNGRCCQRRKEEAVPTPECLENKEGLSVFNSKVRTACGVSRFHRNVHADLVLGCNTNQMQL